MVTEVILLPGMVFVLQETGKSVRPVILIENSEPTISKKTPRQQTLKDCLGELKKHVQVVLLGGKECVLQPFWSTVTRNYGITAK